MMMGELPYYHENAHTLVHLSDAEEDVTSVNNYIPSNVFQCGWCVWDWNKSRRFVQSKKMHDDQSLLDTSI